MTKNGKPIFHVDIRVIKGCQGGAHVITIRNFYLEAAKDLVLPNIAQVDLHEMTVNWNFNE